MAGTTKKTTEAPSSHAPAGAEPRRKQRGEASDILRVEEKRDFTYLGHPKRWDVFETADGFEILPTLVKFEHQPGIAGVLPVKGQPNGNASLALANKVEKKWVIVPQDFPVVAFGEKHVGYVHVYGDEDDEGALAHFERWVRPYRVGDELYFDRDPEGYIQFLRDVRDKLMPKIDPNVRRALQAKLEGMRKTAAGASKKGSLAAGETVEQLEAKLTVFKGGKSATPTTPPTA